MGKCGGILGTFCGIAGKYGGILGNFTFGWAKSVVPYTVLFWTNVAFFFLENFDILGKYSGNLEHTMVLWAKTVVFMANLVVFWAKTVIFFVNFIVFFGKYGGILGN